MLAWVSLRAQIGGDAARIPSKLGNNPQASSQLLLSLSERRLLRVSRSKHRGKFTKMVHQSVMAVALVTLRYCIKLRMRELWSDIAKLGLSILILSK